MSGVPSQDDASVSVPKLCGGAPSSLGPDMVQQTACGSTFDLSAARHIAIDSSSESGETHEALGFSPGACNIEISSNTVHATGTL